MSQAGQFYNPYSMYPAFPSRPAGQTDSFLAYMQDGKVFRQSPEGPQQVGVTTKAYDDLKADYDDIFKRCQQYYDRLVELGEITPEPTQEELLRRQAEQLKQQAEQLARASKVIAESAANQKDLMRVVQELRTEVASLKYTEGAGEHELVTDYIEPVPNITGMAGADQSGVGNNAQLSELPTGLAEGAGGSQCNARAASRRPSISAKRPVARNS